ncbi:MAG: tetratricopeptide repeat protein [Bacteroidales bacterium]|nr:tetratricopeptide repeat protein [Bacteroidales bacterium]MCF8328421.1 tetratricopeptide repeat protein [Bacteroidales bacterium]
MRRLTVLLIAVFISGIAAAQPVKLQSAINYLDDLRLKDAKDAISDALEHEKTKDDPKTWYYKGKIYMSIHMVSTMDDAIEVGMDRKKVEKLLGEPDKDRRRWAEYEPDMRIEYTKENKVEEFNKPADGAYENIAENPLMTAYDAFQKAVKLDDDGGRYGRMVQLELTRLGNLTYNIAVQAYNNQNFKDAKKYFEKTVQIKKNFGETDTNSLYNAAIAATNLEQYDEALDLYLDLVNYKYSNPQVYTSAGQILLSKKDTAKAKSILKKGRERFPGNYYLLINLTNIYLTQGDIQKSKDLLNLALEKQPDNEQLYYNVGVVYDNSSKDTTLSEKEQERIFDLAVKNYKKAIELKEDYFDPIYNLGALYFNDGVQILKEANNLPLDQTEKYEKMKKKAEDKFKKAMPYLEHALELRPEDQNTLTALKELYTRLKKYEKLKEVNAKLGGGKEGQNKQQKENTEE